MVASARCNQDHDGGDATHETSAGAPACGLRTCDVVVHGDHLPFGLHHDDRTCAQCHYRAEATVGDSTILVSAAPVPRRVPSVENGDDFGPKIVREEQLLASEAGKLSTGRGPAPTVCPIAGPVNRQLALLGVQGA